jgi:DNA polymerase III sliding clamp (beta) subunit (PCNA family)
MSAQFLIDAIKELGDDEITLGLTSQLSPVVITPSKSKDCKSVIMPIQIKSEPAN